MRIQKRYFDLVLGGGKTIEVRVAYPSRRSIAAGDLIRFTCGDESALTRVKRVARYGSFEAMFDHERAEAIHPTASRAEQLRAIREIYPAEKEALGVLAIEVEVVAPGR
jgi:ASC-1-like (ASCH) protein